MILKEMSSTPEVRGNHSLGDHLRRELIPHSGRPAFTNGEDVKEQLLVWQAIARLWLAQELGERELLAISRTLAQSRYDWPELQRIYLYEVAPAVHANLQGGNGRGVWGAFDPQWLKGAIMWNMCNPRYRQDALRDREQMTELVARDWESIKQYVHDLRFGRRLTAEEQGAIEQLLQATEQ
jgi:hypothetical protein